MKENELIPIPASLSVFQDKKTGARSIAFPFDFPVTGQHGVLIVTRLSHFAWQPSDDLKSIVINYILPDENKPTT